MFHDNLGGGYTLLRDDLHKKYAGRPGGNAQLNFTDIAWIFIVNGLTGE